MMSGHTRAQKSQRPPPALGMIMHVERFGRARVSRGSIPLLRAKPRELGVVSSKYIEFVFGVFLSSFFAQCCNRPDARDAMASTSASDAALLESQAVYGCELIQSMGILLKLPQVAVSTAQVSFHRFYAKRSMRKFDVRVRALARRARSKKERLLLRRARAYPDRTGLCPRRPLSRDQGGGDAAQDARRARRLHAP